MGANSRISCHRYYKGSGYFAGPGKIAPRSYFAGPGKIVPRSYFAGPGNIAILDLQAILPDQILTKNFILYFVRYSNLHFCLIYLFIHLRYFSINSLLFVPFLCPQLW